MTVLGTVYLNGCNYQIGYDLVSQSTANNTSTVKFYGKLNVTNNYISWSSGTASVRGVSTGIGTYYSKGSHTLVQTQQTITHNADGTYSATVSGSLSTTFVSGTASGKLTLPKINRYPVLNSGSNFTDEGNPVYNITAYGTFPLRVKLEAGGNTQLITRDLSSKNSQTYTLELTNAERTTLRNLIPNNKTLTVTETVCAMNGNTELSASYKSYTMTIVNGNPTFSAAYEDTNSTTTAITGNNQKIIQNKSTLQINATSLSAKKSATLSSIKAVINGTTYNATISGTSATFNIGTLNLSSNTTAKLTLTDSRGLSTTKDLTIQVLQWSVPTAIITTERENNFYNPTTINVDASYSSLDSHNTITIQMRYKKTTDSTYSSYQTMQDNTPVTIQLDNNYQWDVQVVVTDRLGSKTYNVVVERGIPIVFFDKNKRSVGINRFPIETESLEVAGNVVVEGIQTKNMLDQSTIVQGDIVNSNLTLRMSTRQELWLEAGTYTFSTDMTSSYNYSLTTNAVGYPPLSSYPTYHINTSWQSASTYTITLTSSGWFVLSLRRSDNGAFTSTDITNLKSFNYQLEKGNTATAYSPYQNINSRLEPIVLFQKDSGQQGDFTLGDDVSNYKYIEVFFNERIYRQASVKFRADGYLENVPLTIMFGNGTTVFYRSAAYTFSGTSATKTLFLGFQISSSGTITFQPEENNVRITVTKVLGYR